MTIALICPEKDPTPWLNAFNAVAPEIDVVVWPNIPEPKNVTFALCWAHPVGSLLPFTNLKGISSLGAGVDHLLADKHLPLNIPVSRIVDPNLAQGMFNYLLTAVLDHLSAFNKYREQQKEACWQWHRQVPFSKTNIGIMGLGQLGEFSALNFAQLGFNVHGYSSSLKTLNNVTTYGANQLDNFLNKTDILICLLPLTELTKGILNAHLFNTLPKGSYLINVARGGHLIEEDLLVALKSKQLLGACLDVFNQEPLGKEHAFWQSENITITPHCSSLTRPKSVVSQIVTNYVLANKGMALNNQVDLSKQY